DLDNAALLCRAHHSIVHTHRYGARITHGPADTGRPRVEWDLTTNSYDTTLTEWREHQRCRPRSQPRPYPPPAERAMRDA
ncbi:MAG: HNH endonuclease, partial [Pedococcus sp.]